MPNSTNTYISYTSFISPLGVGVNENFTSLLHGSSAIKTIEDTGFFPVPVLASVMQSEQINEWKQTFKTSTRFDTLIAKCLQELLQNCAVDLSSPEVLIILSTTKGNIELLQYNESDEKIPLYYSAKQIGKFLRNPNEVMIVSNACISGVSAAIVARRYLSSHKFKHVLVIGCDAVSRFVLSGFNSFHAVSKNGCRPFDKSRDGVVLGEACGAILYSSVETDIALMHGAVSNDANHISGPSKTGEELAYCIIECLNRANVSADEIDFISAHGTATVYNDDMESKAFQKAGLSNVPVFSVKANYGHTLGAAGVIETIISAECLQRNLILPSLGFETLGVEGNIKVNNELLQRPLKYAVKSASGFGGCNASILLKKK